MPESKPTIAIVPVKPAWASKVNWAVGVSFLAALLAVFNIEFSADLQTKVIQWITLTAEVIAPLAAFVFNTWFRKSVTAPSVVDAPTALVDPPVLHAAYGLGGAQAVAAADLR